MRDDIFDEAGFATLTEIFRTRRANFAYLTFEPEPEESELMALNPRAFSVTAPVEDMSKTSSATAEMLNRLFETVPHASVIRIKVSPDVAFDKDWSPSLIGGTITISGTF